MSVRAYLIRIVDFYVSEEGYSVFRFEDTREEIFNVWHHSGIVEMIINYGIDSTNQDGIGVMEIASEGIESFKESIDFDRLTDEELQIFKVIEQEVENSKFGIIQFDCW